MQQASFTGLLRTLLILGALYYLGKFFFKYLFPILLTNYIKKKTQTQQVDETSTFKEGTTTIDKKPEQKNVTNNNVGEYVDFEEIE